MDIKIETLPKYRIAYVRQVGSYGPANSQAMEKLKQWAKRKNLLTESTILLGVPQDNPETTLPENCRYDACIVISKDYLDDELISESELDGGTYVICTIKHTAEAIQRAWNEIFPYLQKTGYQMDNKPILERYIGEMLNNDFCEICVPIKPL
ncbi:DNA gyrase inhibitor GyrI [Paenibacillus algorifonticola]|uniref:DNA gyrase inhibitor GyrI n=1 Tax=Paenibacillus algorifonticola TaxID=684063 RepID=A0A1I2IYN3_9BACL|nr:GyrI-like domain-containing protein [Paenibacillus algorifonticola]SFF47404.1 DNA gyrase inhibitor GyrI [Paenibacillus algorifonticola]